MNAPDWATLTASLLVGLGALAGMLRYVVPRIGRFFSAMDRMFETINGRPAKLDKAGRVEEEAVPSLGVQLADLKTAISDQQLQNRRLTAIEETQAQHAKMLAAHAQHLERYDELSQVERIVTKAESHQALKTIEAVATNPPEDE